MSARGPRARAAAWGRAGTAILATLVWIVALCTPARAATIVVDTLDDAADPPFDADGFCGTGAIADLPGADGHVSLREAIIAANNTPMAQTITFAPALRGGTIHIGFDDTDADSMPDSLPVLCDDGTTVNGDLDADGQPDITLDGSGLASSATGLLIVSSHNLISGVRVHNVPFAGIGVNHVAAFSSAPGLTDNRISQNEISGSSYGIFVIAGSDAPASAGAISDTMIDNNRVTDTTAYDGIFVSTSPTAGSSLTNTMLSRNRISSALRHGIFVLAGYYAGGANTTIAGVVLRDNEVFDNGAQGIAVSSFGGRGHTIRGVEVSTNNVHDNGSVGIALAGGVCGATEGVLEAGVIGNTITDNGRADDAPGIVLVGGSDYRCETGLPQPAAQNRLTATVEGNTLSGNRGGHVNVSGGQVGANHNMVAATLTNNAMRGGLVGIVISGGIGTIAEAAQAADDNMVRAVVSGNQVRSTLGGILISGGTSGPASRNHVDVLAEENQACGNQVSDISCVGGFPGASIFPANTGTDNVVSGSIRANEASVIIATAGVIGNTCAAVVQDNRACGAPTPTATALAGSCTGDCNGNGEVTIDELLLLVGIALDTQPLSGCTAGDSNHDGAVTVDEIVAAVIRALDGCAPSPATPTPTPTPPAVCNPASSDCPVGMSCECCCGAWRCFTVGAPPPCCALSCS